MKFATFVSIPFLKKGKIEWVSDIYYILLKSKSCRKIFLQIRTFAKYCWFKEYNFANQGE